jgi:acylaminoacyl-peptidase
VVADWCVVESCGSGVYDFSTYAAASEEVLLAMRRCSPIHHVQHVRAPTLICLGGKDRRVPPSQGLEYHHVLRAQGVETRCGSDALLFSGHCVMQRCCGS